MVFSLIFTEIHSDFSTNYNCGFILTWFISFKVALDP